MCEQVVLAVVDGMRPDGIAACGHPFFMRLAEESTHCLNAKTITRPITLPAHISLFTSVDQHHHTNLNNEWHPYPAPYDGILEVVHKAGKKTAMFVTWEPLRHLGRAGSVDRLDFQRGDVPGRSFADALLFERAWTQRVAKVIQKAQYDFIFYYFEMADVVGHQTGWMSKAYLDALFCAGTCLELLFDACQPHQQFIVAADHGGHDTVHNDPGNPFDMTIPIYCAGSLFKKNRAAKNWYLLDIAPTVSRILQAETPAHYQGKPLL